MSGLTDIIVQYWEHLPVPAQVAISGTAVGIFGNYGTRILDTLYALVFEGSVQLPVQLAFVLIGGFLLYDFVQQARFNRLERRLVGEGDES